MKRIKNILLIFILTFTIIGFSSGKLNNNVLANEEPKDERLMKAVWISPVVGELPYNGETAFKNYMNDVFEILEYYGYNTLIFHVRTHNNAMYKSTINPKHSLFASVNYDIFDPLEWVIEESHKRGIELHAWLNPYRIGTNYTGSMPAANPASNPDNILTNSDNARILDPSKEIVRTHINNTILEIVEQYDVDAIHFDDYFYINNVSPQFSAAEKRGHIDSLIEGIYDVLSNFNEQNNRNVQFGISPTGIYRNGNGTVTYDSNGMPITNGSQTGGQEHYASYLFADTVKWAKEGWIDYLMPQVYWARNHSIASFTKILDWWNKVFKNLNVNLYTGIGVYMADSDGNTFDWQNDMFEMDSQLSYIDTLDKVEGYSVFSYKHLVNGYNNSNALSGQQIRNAYLTNERKKITVLPEVRSMTPVIPGSVNSTSHNSGTLSWNSVNNAKFYYVYRSTGTVTFSSDEIVGVIGAKAGINTFNTGDISNTYNYGVRALSTTNHLSPLEIQEPVENYSIEYVLNGGTFPVEGYASRDEMIDDFLSDFYEFLNDKGHISGVSINDFIHGVGNTNGYGGSYDDEAIFAHLYSPNNKTINPDTGKFINLSEYNKWVPLFDLIDEYVITVNSNQNFWGSLYTGRLRLKHFIIKHDYGKLETHPLFDIIPEGLETSLEVAYSYNQNTLPIALPEVIKDGYIFSGWYTDPNFSGSPVTSIPIGSTGNKTYYAKWLSDDPNIEYVNVSFDLNGGLPLLPIQTIEKGTTINIPTEPTRTYYNFTGWTVNGVAYNFINPVNEDITLKANWEIKQIDISFDINYSGGTNPSLQTININTIPSKPLDPTRSGYTFKGWLLNEEPYNFNTPLLEDATLVASWETIKIYKVIFTIGYTGGTSPATQDIVEGEFAVMPAEPSRDGYEFMGWHLNDELFNFNTPITENILLRAVWGIEQIIISFDVNYSGGTNPNSQSININTMPTKPVDPLRVGYVFDGWLLDNNIYNFDTPLSNSTTLVGSWHSVPTYEVSFDLNYLGSINPNSEIVTEGQKAAEPTEPIRVGYIFKGWYLNDTIYNFNNNVNSNLNLVASWEQIILTVSYDLNYIGGISPLDEEVSYGSKVIRPVDPTREDYIFIGWYLNETLYDFNDLLTNSLVLVAKWEIEKVEVTFDNSFETQQVVTIDKGSQVTKPTNPVKEGYEFIGWLYNEQLFDFNTVLIADIVLIAKWEVIIVYDDVVLMLEKTNIRPESNSKSQALRFYANLNSNYEFSEHGFYIIYGKATVSDLNEVLNDDNPTINNKKIFKVSIESYDEEYNYSVLLTGIPTKGYFDVITVVAYVVIDENIVLSNNSFSSSFGQTVLEEANNEIVNNDLLDEIEDNFKEVVEDDNKLVIADFNIYELDIEVLKDEFINDWNKYFNLNLTNIDGLSFYNLAKEGSNDPYYNNFNLSETNIYKFFNNPFYNNKWGWLLTYLKELDQTTDITIQIDALKGDGSSDYPLYNAHHISYAISNFFNQTNEKVNGISIDFTDSNKYISLLYFNKGVYTNTKNKVVVKLQSKLILPEITKIPLVGYKYVYSDGINTYEQGSAYIVKENIELQIIEVLIN